MIGAMSNLSRRYFPARRGRCKEELLSARAAPHAWIEIHRDELLANWELASQGNTVFKIEPLR
jgi:hypothetical protein